MKRRIIAGTLALGLLAGWYFWLAWQGPQVKMAAAQASENMAAGIINQTLTSADTEYHITTLPSNCKYFSIQCRTAADVRYAFVTGKVATPTSPYMTLKSGSALNSPEKMISAPDLYLASSSAGVVVEILYWQ